MRFGAYTFPGTFYITRTPRHMRLGMAEIPRGDGVAIGEATVKEKTIHIAGRFASPDVLRTVQDDLLAVLKFGRQRLYIDPALDRYVWAHLMTILTSYDPGLSCYICDLELVFLCDDPFWEANVESSNTWYLPIETTPVVWATHDITVGGNAHTWPTFELTVSGTGTLDITLGLDTGDEFVLSGDVSDGDVLVVNMAEHTVTLQSDGSDQMALFDGSFFRFEGNQVNTLIFEDRGIIPTIVQIVTKWRNRWY